MRKFALAVGLVLMASGAQAATLNVVDGQLMGASGVIVDGTAYNVQFLDGTCIDLYDGCDEVSDFTFQGLSSATAAAQATGTSHPQRRKTLELKAGGSPPGRRARRPHRPCPQSARPGSDRGDSAHRSGARRQPS